MSCVYILQSGRNNKYYIGSTENLNKRFTEHNNGYGGVFTKSNRPWSLVCYKEFENIERARQEEQKIKIYKRRGA